MQEQEEDEKWRGCSMQEVYRNLNEYELKHSPDVKPSEAHTVLYNFPFNMERDGVPTPYKGLSKWDSFHVRLPCSNKSQYPVQNENGTATIESRWEMIEKALLRPINSSKELELAILSYNLKYQNVWKFRALHKLFSEMDEDESAVFFNQLLPKIIGLALRLPELIQTAIPLLKQGQNKSISLSQQQASSLLANAFLCTYPRRNAMKNKSEYSSFPDINFNRLFQSSGDKVIEKIKCILHYFKRVCNVNPRGVLTFTRRFIPLTLMPNWSKQEVPLGITPLHVTSIGTIEDQGTGLLQVDFANKFLGGGVLGTGCVQEEIRFVINPELIISKLFTECLKPNEALIMQGSEQFSKYKGYALSFEWNGNVNDTIPFDESYRRQCTIVAIDALHFLQTDHQFKEELMVRELNKAYVGFYHPLETIAPGVASGNWGCGAFGGQATLKALLQLMACTITKRPLVYYTFGDVELRNKIHEIHTFFIEENVKVKDLWYYLRKFSKQNIKGIELYSFIKKEHLRSRKADNIPSSSGSQTTEQLNEKITQNRLTLRSQIEKKNNAKMNESIITEVDIKIDEDNEYVENISKINNIQSNSAESKSINSTELKHDERMKNHQSTSTDHEIKKLQPTLHQMLDKYYYSNSCKTKRNRSDN